MRVFGLSLELRFFGLLHLIGLCWAFSSFLPSAYSACPPHSACLSQPFPTEQPAAPQEKTLKNRYRSSAPEPSALFMPAETTPSAAGQAEVPTVAPRLPVLPAAEKPEKIPPVRKHTRPLRSVVPPYAGFEGCERLTLEQVCNESLRANPALMQLAREVEAMRGVWMQAGLKENPMLGYAAEEMTASQTGKHGFEFSQTIVRKYKLNARQAAACRDFLAAQQRCRVQQQRVMNDALLVAYQTALAQRKVVLLHELLSISSEALHSSKMLLEAQEISKADYLESKIEAERTGIALRNAEIAHKTAGHELALLLGRSDTEGIYITDAIESLPRDRGETEAMAMLLAQSPELTTAWAQVDAARAHLTRECAEAGIDFDAGAAILYDTEAKETQVSLGVSIPIRVHNRNQGNIYRARSELAAAQRNVERIELLLTTRFHKIFGACLMARNKVESYERSLLAEARESFDLSLGAYRQGEYGALELLNAQRTLIAVQVEHLESLGEFWESHILLEGSLLSGGLEL